MKTFITLLFMLPALLLCGRLQAQFILFDDFDGNGPCSGNWDYYKGASSATGKVEFNVPNPSMSGLNTSAHVAKFTKDTTCTEYMLAGCDLDDTLDLSRNNEFRLLVYSSLTEEVLFKLQPGSDYTKAVFFKYKIKNSNTWEEATYSFASVKNRTDFDRVEVHFMDGKKANGILYFDLVEGPNPVSIALEDQSIVMGQEDGVIMQALLHGDKFDSILNKANWITSGLPPGVHIDSVYRVNDTTANIVLGGNSTAIYSRSVFKLTIGGAELQAPGRPPYAPAGNVVFEGNPAWTMVFSDEFETDGIPDLNKWKVDPKPKGWINGEKQVYTDTSFDNARVKDGSLVITGKKDYPNITTEEPWSSARVITQNKFDFKYGKVEVRAKLPRARGSWPAIWLLPTTTVYGAWPKSGEIDIMEHVGNNFSKVLSTVHTQNNNWTNNGHLSATRTIPDVDTVFHVYAMEWTEDSLRFTYDDVHCYTYVNPKTDWKDWPFDQRFYIILNVAIGGGMGGSITDADWPDSMSVDYVRVYQKGLGTPVLDSMVISPTGRAVVPGKKQQYTVKIFDQNDYAMDVTPVWSITGAGNTIDSTGLATIYSVGTVTAAATDDTVSLSVSANVTVRTPDYKPIPARIEAEDNDYTNICCTEPVQDTSGVVCVNYISSSSWLEYDIDVPDTASYRFQFRVAVNTASTIRIVLDNNVLATVHFPVSGGWQKWSTVTTVPITLPAGQQTVRIEAATSGWNFNWLRIIEEDDVPVSFISVTPDSASVFIGGRVQYKAAVYGQDSSRFDVKPVWSATAGSIANTGIFTADSIPGLYTISATTGGVTGTAKINVQGPPQLAYMVLVPDTVIIPYGASQQFSINGYDQYDSAFTVTGATWSVTGSGNSVTQTGAVTTGMNGGIVTATKDSISGSALFTLDYICSFNKLYEAESASSKGSGPTLETTTDTSGGQNFTGIVYNNWFAYNKLSIPVGGKYNIHFRISTTATAKIRLENNGKTFGIIDLPNTGGVWTTVSDTITLPAMNYFNVRAHQGSFKFNWFSIDNCAVDMGSGMMSSIKATKPVLENPAVKIYPNPTTGMITLDIPVDKYNTVRLLDINGRLVTEWKIGKDVTRFNKNLDFLSDGIYILQLDGKGQTDAVKFIKN